MIVVGVDGYLLAKSEQASRRKLTSQRRDGCRVRNVLNHPEVDDICVGFVFAKDE